MSYETEVITGPCIITWNSVTWFSQGDVTVNIARDLTHLSAAQFGRFDSRHKSGKITVSFTPVGRVAEVLGVLAAFDGKVPGQSLVPGGTGAELALVIKPIFNAGGASRDWTFLRAGLTAVGDFNVSSQKTQCGQLTFTVLESLVTANTWFTTSAWSAFPTEAEGFDPTTVYTMPARAIWASNPASLASGDYQFHSVDGWTIGYNVTANEHFREGFGIADITLGDYVLQVTGSAANWYDYTGAQVTEQSMPAAQPFAGTRPGQRATRKKLHLKTYANDAASAVLTSGSPLWEFPAAELDTTALVWGAQANRTGNIKFTIIPTFTTGVRSVVTADAQA